MLFETFRVWQDTDASVVRLRCLFATRTRSATGCAESRNTPADRYMLSSVFVAA
jgi:hypothetical protein